MNLAQTIQFRGVYFQIWTNLNLNESGPKFTEALYCEYCVLFLFALHNGVEGDDEFIEVEAEHR